MLKDSIEALRQYWDPLIQEACLYSLASPEYYYNYNYNYNYNYCYYYLNPSVTATMRLSSRTFGQRNIHVPVQSDLLTCHQMCKNSYKPLFFRNYIQFIGHSFIYRPDKGRKICRRIFSVLECVILVQGHPRSKIFVPIESTYATS